MLVHLGGLCINLRLQRFDFVVMRALRLLLAVSFVVDNRLVGRDRLGRPKTVVERADDDDCRQHAVDVVRQYADKFRKLLPQQRQEFRSAGQRAPHAVRNRTERDLNAKRRF